MIAPSLARVAGSGSADDSWTDWLVRERNLPLLLLQGRTCAQEMWLLALSAMGIAA